MSIRKIWAAQKKCRLKHDLFQTAFLRMFYLLKKISVHGKTYACRRVRRPTKLQKIRLCFTVKRNRLDSLPSKPTAAHAMAMD